MYRTYSDYKVKENFGPRITSENVRPRGFSGQNRQWPWSPTVYVPVTVPGPVIRGPLPASPPVVLGSQLPKKGANRAVISRRVYGSVPSVVRDNALVMERQLAQQSKSRAICPLGMPPRDVTVSSTKCDQVSTGSTLSMYECPVSATVTWQC